MRPWELHPPSLELQLLQLLELELFELLVELLVELELLKWTFRSQEVARTCGSIGEAPGRCKITGLAEKNMAFFGYPLGTGTIFVIQQCSHSIYLIHHSATKFQVQSSLPHFPSLNFHCESLLQNTMHPQAMHDIPKIMFQMSFEELEKLLYKLN